MKLSIKFEQSKVELFVKYLLLVFVFLSIFLGNTTAHFKFLGLRESQWVTLALFPFLIYLGIKKKLYKDPVVQILSVFMAFGLFQAYRAYQDMVPFKFWLAASGMYLYPIFFLMSFVAFDKKDIKFLFNIIVAATLLGALWFVGEYFYTTHQLPFLVRTSSDILPTMAAGLIASLAYSLRFRMTWYLIVLIPLLLFSALMFVKGAVLAIFAALFLMVFRKNLGVAILLALTSAGVALWSVMSNIGEYTSYANQGDIFWYNIVTRLLVWQDYFKDFLLFPVNFVFGSGLVPFFSNSIYTSLAMSLFSDCNGVIHFNPHNSYLLMIHFSGFVSLALFFGVILKVLSLKSIVMDKQLALLLPLALFFLMLAMTTPVFELHYLAPVFWMIFGVIYRYRQPDQKI